MKMLPLHSPRPWYRFDEQIVDRNHDPVFTLHVSRHAGEDVRLTEAANAAAAMAIPEMLSALIDLVEGLKAGFDAGLDAVEVRHLFQVAANATAAAIGVPIVAVRGGAA